MIHDGGKHIHSCDFAGLMKVLKIRHTIYNTTHNPVVCCLLAPSSPNEIMKFVFVFRSFEVRVRLEIFLAVSWGNVSGEPENIQG